MDKDQLLDFDAIARSWNSAVRLTRPTVGQIMALANNLEPTIVYENVPDFIYLGNNLMLKLPLGARFVADNSVQAILLITVDNYFSKRALVETRNISHAQLFGISLKGSATEVLQDLKTSELGTMDLATEFDRWLIFIGKALCLEFLPNDPERKRPEESRLGAIEFNFGPSSHLMVPPDLSFERP